MNAANEAVETAPTTSQPMPATCPCCGFLFNRLVNIEVGEPHAPSPGDVMVCFECEAVLEFGDHLELVRCNLDALEPVLRARLEAAVADLVMRMRAIEKQTGRPL